MSERSASERAAKIFISYRREDSATICGRIYDWLGSRFGKEMVFMDVDYILGGEDFPRLIGEVLPKCAVQLVIIGPHWLDIKGADGMRRLEQPDDWVRREIEGALAQGITIIPVLVKGAKMPPTEELPQSLQSLKRFHGFELHEGPDFGDSMRRIIYAVQEHVIRNLADPQPSPAIPIDRVRQLIPEIEDAARRHEWQMVIDKAEYLIEHARAAVPSPIYRLYGRALVELGELERAREALDRALVLKPDDVPTLLAAARVRRELGQEAEAAPLLRKVLALVSDRAERLALLREYAALLASLKRWDDLLPRTDEALRLAPDDPAWLELRQNALIELHRLPEALEIARKLTIRPVATAAQWLTRARLARAVANDDAEVRAAIEAAVRVNGAGTTEVARARWELLPPAITPERFPGRLADLGFEALQINGVEVIVPPAVPVPAGEFLMGSDLRRDPHDYDDERPQHRVLLPDFQLAKFPVTVAEYACFVRAGQAAPQDWQNLLANLDHPVVSVSWYDATAYAAWLAALTGQPWRLPTEAEWEKAARWDPAHAVSRIYPWGDAWDKSRANTKASGIGTTTPVGRYPTGESPCRALDLAGNVWEWTSSLFRPYPYKQNDGREGHDSTGYRVLRGGSWDGNPRVARSAYRFRGVRAHLSDLSYGFRLLVAASDS